MNIQSDNKTYFSKPKIIFELHQIRNLESKNPLKFEFDIPSEIDYEAKYCFEFKNDNEIALFKAIWTKNELIRNIVFFDKLEGFYLTISKIKEKFPKPIKKTSKRAKSKKTTISSFSSQFYKKITSNFVTKNLIFSPVQAIFCFLKS